MNDETPMKPSVLLPLIGFGVTLLMAVVVLVTTAIIALAEVVGRAWIAALIVAVALLFVSWLIYLLWARVTSSSGTRLIISPRSRMPTRF